MRHLSFALAVLLLAQAAKVPNGDWYVAMTASDTVVVFGLE